MPSLVGLRAWTLMLGSWCKDVSGRRTSTGSEACCLLIFLEATKFVLLSIFTLTETNCHNIWKKLLPSDKMASSGWRAWLQTSLLKLPVFASKGKGLPPYTSYVTSTVMYCWDFYLTDLWWSSKFWPFSVGDGSLIAKYKLSCAEKMCYVLIFPN